MKRLLLLLPIITMALPANAQTKEVVSFEQIKSQCAAMPLEKRARVRVARFNVTTRTDDAATQQNANANNNIKALSVSRLFGGGGAAPRADEIPPILGANLAACLTDALQSISCFRVLETLANSTDITNEIDAGTNKYSSKKAPKAGKVLGPQITATGEVTEFSNQSRGVNVGGIGAGKKTMKMGFILKLVNTETGDVIFSRQIRAQAKAAGSVSVLGLVSTSNSDPATAAVLDDGVLQAIGLMVHVRDSLNITVDNIPGSASTNPNGDHETEISLSNANYAKYTAMAVVIAALPGYKSMEKTFSGGVATYTVIHSGGASKLADALGGKLGSGYDIVGVSDDKIELKAK